jgi:hypothetical protein
MDATDAQKRVSRSDGMTLSTLPPWPALRTSRRTVSAFVQPFSEATYGS